MLETAEKFVKHMPDSEDPSLFVLKGHLLVEEALDRTLEAGFADATLIAKSNFMFHKKLIMSQAIDRSRSDPQGWQVIKKLNELRNHLVHSLDPDQLGDRMEDLLDEATTWVSKGDTEGSTALKEELNSDKPLRLRFWWAVFFMICFLDAVGIHLKSLHEIATKLDPIIRAARSTEMAKIQADLAEWSAKKKVEIIASDEF